MTYNMQLIESLEPEELSLLKAQWGTTPSEHYDLGVDHPFLSGDNQMLTKDRRRAEICYVMHQGDPVDGLLLHIKSFYPEDAYRLPTGGIHEGEAVLETLAREIQEETGLIVGESDEYVVIQRFLGVLSYEFRHKTQSQVHTFATYHFLVQMPQGAEIVSHDPSEQIDGWRWCPLVQLEDVAAYLDNVGSIASGWADWGRFRALSHRFIAKELSI